jgi:signal transduction histidine kinase
MERLVRVLIVDDQASQPSLEHLLQASALAVEISNAVSLKAAIAELKNYSFDCVLLNCASLPNNFSEANYLESQTLSELRSLTQAIPIIAITDMGIPDDAEAGVQSEKVQKPQSSWTDWELLERSLLSPMLLGHAVEWSVRVHQAEQQANSAARRLRQTDQLLVQQRETIEAQAQQIQQLNTQLLEAAKLKEQFLATISHELRTPMNAIIGFSQLLHRQQESLNARQASMIQRILANAKQLLSIIDQMLIFSRIEAGQLTLHPESFNLVHLIRTVIEELEPTAAKKHLKLNLRLYLDDPIITTDPTCLQQVLLNLISNAIKFTPAGTITIEATSTKQHVILAIRDTGIGMKPTEVEHIFEPFRQADQSLTRQYRGLGLGLAVTAAMVQQMQGTIAVKSQLGQGSEFWVELPRQITNAGAVRTPASIGSGQLH